MITFRLRRLTQNPAVSSDEAGFGLAEFLVASFVLLLASGAAFRILGESQQAAGYQTEMNAVLDNTRTALDTVGRYIRQAGNDPHHAGLAGVTIMGATEVRIRSDMTGSAGPANPDKGDPDGDTLDAGEDVTIRYKAASHSVEVLPDGGSAQTIASYISAFALEFCDAGGAATAVGANVRKINVSISGTSTILDPRTRKTYGITLASDIQIGTRQY